MSRTQKQKEIATLQAASEGGLLDVRHCVCRRQLLLQSSFVLLPLYDHCDVILVVLFCPTEFRMHAIFAGEADILGLEEGVVFFD